MDVSKFEQQFSCFKLGIENYSEETTITLAGRLLRDYSEYSYCVQSVLKEICSRKPNYIDNLKEKYGSGDNLPDASLRKLILTLLSEREKEYNKRALDFTCRVRRGLDPEDQFRKSLIEDYPEHKEDIAAIGKTSSSNVFMKTKPEPSAAAFVSDDSQTSVPQKAKVKSLGPASKLVDESYDQKKASSSRLELFKTQFSLFKISVDERKPDVELRRVNLLKDFPEEEGVINAEYEHYLSCSNASNVPYNKDMELSIEDDKSVVGANSVSTVSVPAPKPPADEAYKGKRFCYCKYRPFQIINVDESLSESGEEPHPNFLTELRRSQKWTVLIDETGTFKRNETTNGRVVGIFIPHNVCLKPCTVHAQESSFSKVEDAILTLLNSSCGVLGVSVDSLGYPADNPRAACIEQLLLLAFFMLPYERDKKLMLDVKVERRLYFDENNDLSLLRSIVKDHIAKLYPDFVKDYLTVNFSVVDKGYELIGYPDSVAYLWGSNRWSHLRNYTCWRGTCLIEKGKDGKTLNDAFEKLTPKLNFSPMKWEALLASRDSDSLSIVNVVLDHYGRQVISSSVWNAYLLYLYQYAIPGTKIYPALLLKEIRWLERYIPSNNKTWGHKYLSDFCQNISSKLLACFENDEQRREEFKQICTRLIDMRL